MKYILEIKLKKAKGGSSDDISEIGSQFGKLMFSILQKYLPKGAEKEIIEYYYNDCIEDDWYFLDNTISMIFTEAAGMCALSCFVSFHWTKIVLAHNKAAFDEFFASAGWEIDMEFDSLETENEHFFIHKKKVYGIKKDVQSPYLIYNSGEELEFEELPTNLQKKYAALLEDNSCQCSICSQKSKGVLQKIQFENILFQQRFNRLYAEVDKYYEGKLSIDDKTFIVIEELISLLQNATASDIGTIKPNHHHNAYSCSGYIYRKEKKYERAIELFDKAIELDKKWPDNHSNKGFCLRKTGKIKEAIETLTKGLSYSPNDPGMLNNRCDYYITSGDLENARKDALKLIEIEAYKVKRIYLDTIMEYFFAVEDEEGYFNYLPLVLELYEKDEAELHENEYIKNYQNTERFKEVLKSSSQKTKQVTKTNITEPLIANDLTKILALSNTWKRLGIEPLNPGTIPTGYTDLKKVAIKKAWEKMFSELTFFAHVDIEGSYLAFWQYEKEINPEILPIVKLDSEGQLETIGENIADAFLWLVDSFDLDFEKSVKALQSANIECSNSIDEVREKVQYLPNPNDRCVYYQQEASTSKRKAKTVAFKTDDPKTVEDLLGMEAKDKRVVDFLASLQSGKKKIEIQTDGKGRLKTIFLMPEHCKPIPILGVVFGEDFESVVKRLGPPTTHTRWDSGDVARCFDFKDNKVHIITLMIRATAP